MDLWPVIVVCVGAASPVGGCDAAAMHYAPPAATEHECLAVVASLKRSWATDDGWCAEVQPGMGTPLPDAPALPEGYARATAEAQTPPQAQPPPGGNCALTEVIEADLRQKWGEAPGWVGVANDGKTMIQLWSGPKPSWTLVTYYPPQVGPDGKRHGISCAVASGAGNEFLVTNTRINLER